MNIITCKFMKMLPRIYIKVWIFVISLACIKNDGLYVKFGQGMAALDHLLPPPFYKYMSKLQDQAKSVSYDKISKLFEEEVGRPID